MNIQRLFERIMSFLTWTAALMSIGTLIYLVGFILVKGIPYIKPSLFSFTYNS